MPNQLAVGAAWDPAYAQALGTILGQELAAVGINMLLGPSLDVLDPPGRQPSGIRATSTYGSDSWWVAENGAAFIQGIADGSDGRVLTVPGHFRDRGAATATWTMNWPRFSVRSRTCSATNCCRLHAAAQAQGEIGGRSTGGGRRPADQPHSVQRVPVVARTHAAHQPRAANSRRLWHWTPLPIGGPAAAC